MKIPWWGYVVLAGLSWGTYVPIIFYGGSVLGGNASARLMAILCVGVAYFVLAVVLPLGAVDAGCLGPGVVAVVSSAATSSRPGPRSKRGLGERLGSDAMNSFDSPSVHVLFVLFGS